MNISLCLKCPHRQQVCGGPCPCLVDGRDIIDHATAGDCPKGYFAEPEKMPPRAAVTPPPLPPELAAIANRSYHELWADIHSRPKAMRDPAEEMKYLRESVAARLPCGECKTEWLAALKRTPPDLSSPEAYFAWTVARHNEVNVRKGKPVVSLDEARCLYGWCSCGANQSARPDASESAE
jgi:hypothetical protein